MKSQRLYPLLLALALYAAFDAAGDAIQFQGWLSDLGRWFTLDNWRVKYRNPDGPFNFTNWKWWMFVGGGSFIDAWHTLKTLKIMVAVYAVLRVSKRSLLWMPVAWAAYGVLFNLFYSLVK